MSLGEIPMTPDFWLRMAVAIPVILGIKTLFDQGMLLGWLGDAWERRLPEMICKPLFSCAPCMASGYGTLIWFLTGGSVDWWLPFVLALCGFLRIITAKLL